MIDKDDFKRKIDIDMIFDLLQYFEANPIRKNEKTIISDTVCHNHPGEGSQKLYTYWNDDMAILNCYTECGSFDVIELVIKVFELKGQHFEMYDAMNFLINYFSLDFEEDFSNDMNKLSDWQYFKKYAKIQSKDEKQKRIELRVYDDKILKNLPRPHFLNWEREGIKKDVCDARNICYDPATHGIVIPHYDVGGRLVGIRERTLIEENEVYGKYLPAVMNHQMYNHPLGVNLYNLNFSKENITKVKTAIVFEGEKSPLKFASLFGLENDISVACCGSNLTSQQFKLLYDLGVNEIVIAFDRQYQKCNSKDKEWSSWTKKLYNIHNKFGQYVQISYMFDKGDLLDYKDSPIDKDKETFLQLYKNRIFL